MRLIIRSHDRAHGTDADDSPLNPLVDHVTRHRLRAQKHGLEIGVQQSVPLLLAAFVERAENPHAGIVHQNVHRAHERFDVLHQNVGVARGFKPMTAEEMQALRDRCAKLAGDGRYEFYKLSLRFDNPQARLAHDIPLDITQKEVQEMLFKEAGGP